MWFLWFDSIICGHWKAVRRQIAGWSITIIFHQRSSQWEYAQPKTVDIQRERVYSAHLTVHSSVSFLFAYWNINYWVIFKPENTYFISCNFRTMKGSMLQYVDMQSIVVFKNNLFKFIMDDCPIILFIFCFSILSQLYFDLFRCPPVFICLHVLLQCYILYVRTCIYLFVCKLSAMAKIKMINQLIFRTHRLHEGYFHMQYYGIFEIKFSSSRAHHLDITLSFLTHQHISVVYRKATILYTSIANRVVHILSLSFSPMYADMHKHVWSIIVPGAYFITRLVERAFQWSRKKELHSHKPWDAITHPCPNFNGGFVKNIEMICEHFDNFIIARHTGHAMALRYFAFLENKLTNWS